MYNCERNFAKNWITIDTSVVKSFFKLGYKLPCGEKQLLLNSSATIYIYRKGKEQEAPLVTYNAFQIDDNGYVGFYWDDTFLAAESGYYVGDVYFCNEYCFSVNFIIPRCRTRVLDSYNEIEPSCLPACGTDAIGGVDCPITVDACNLPAPDIFPTANPISEPASCPTEIADCCSETCE